MGASEVVRACCWLSLGDEAEQRETRSSVHTAVYEYCQPECECVGVIKTRLDKRRGDSGGHGLESVSACRMCLSALVS